MIAIKEWRHVTTKPPLPFPHQPRKTRLSSVKVLGFAGQYRVGNVQFISNLLSAFGALGNVDPLYLPSIYFENLNSLPSLCAHMHDSAWRGRCSRRRPPRAGSATGSDRPGAVRAAFMPHSTPRRRKNAPLLRTSTPPTSWLNAWLSTVFYQVTVKTNRLYRSKNSVISCLMPIPPEWNRDWWYYFHLLKAAFFITFQRKRGQYDRILHEVPLTGNEMRLCSEASENVQQTTQTFIKVTGHQDDL